MLNYPLNRFSDMAALAEDEVSRLRSLGDPPVSLGRNAFIRSEGDAVTCIYLMIEGWVTASMTLPSGGRQIMKIHLPGDMLGTPSMALDSAAETLFALTDCVVAPVPLVRLGELFTTHPRLAALFLMGVQIERVALMDAMVAMGRTSAREQVVSFYLDLHDRLSRIGMVADSSFTVPMSQEQISEKLGLTSVHVNRTLRALDAEGLITRSGRRVQLHDVEALRGISQLAQRKFRSQPEWFPKAAQSS